ncbi:exosome complex exonuclease RRP42-like [Oppia nitens]|uniref:exosome complex exonuclease RRP42-like n=1 Tax=Oppia nitens TaxID=1686743 RepID=UPI0023DBE1EA|nr:exosome complex exonuclease RRP42-like [Oppia nitens]
MSLMSVISEGERKYICGGIDVNMRSDGRSCDDYQLITIERDVTNNCDGSAHIRCGNNDVLVGIKLEIESVIKTQEWDQRGRIDFSADITANASPMFEGKQGEDMTNILVNLFSESIPHYIDLKSLVVVPNRSFWVIHIDIVVLECGSLPSLIDCAAFGIKAALFDTKIPKVSIVSDDSNDFVVSEDEFESTKLDVTRVPLFVSVSRISTRYVVDVTREEEEASIASISYAINSFEGIVYMKKLKSGSLHPEPIKDIFEKVQNIGHSLNECLISKLTDSQNKGKISFLMN